MFFAHVVDMRILLSSRLSNLGLLPDDPHFLQHCKEICGLKKIQNDETSHEVLLSHENSAVIYQGH